jgi:hypothetical protein
MKHFTTLLKGNRIQKISGGFLKAILFSVLVHSTLLAQHGDRSVHVGLVYPISNHGASAVEYSNIFSLHAIAGLSGEESGAAISGFTNIVRGDGHGLQLAGFSNHIRGYADGATISGFVNTYGSAKGAQIAGFANIARKNVTGAQVAGFINTSRERSGIQLAGFTNIATNVNGQQIAGFVNKAADVNGVQLGGFINVAKKVKGVQMAGLINIADSSDYPIGIINIVKNGERRIGVSTDDNFTTLVAFRSGGRVLYGIFGIGHNLKNTEDVYSVQYGLGAHLFERKYFRLNAEITTTQLENFKRGSFVKYTSSLQPAFRIGNTFEVFGGPSLNFINTNTPEGKKLIDNYIWNDVNRSNHLRGMYVGYTAGLHVKI